LRCGKKNLLEIFKNTPEIFLREKMKYFGATARQKISRPGAWPKNQEQCFSEAFGVETAKNLSISAIFRIFIDGKGKIVHNLR
jgi:hypothetical protein